MCLHSKRIFTLGFRIVELKDSLCDLNFGFNKISSISSELCMLHKLTHLDIRFVTCVGLPFPVTCFRAFLNQPSVAVE